MARLVAFLGRDVVLRLALSLALGVLLFATELALAHGLQGFAAALGLAAAPVPFFDPARPAALALALAALAAARGALAGAGAYVQGSATERFKHAERARLVRRVFGAAGGPVSSARVNTLFHEQVTQAAHAVAHLQAAILDLTVAVCLLPGLFLLAPGLTALALPLLAIPLLPLRLLKARLARLSQALAGEWARATRRLTAGMANLLLLRIHGTAAREAQLAEASLARVHDHTLGYHRLAGAEIAYAQALSVALVCVVGLAARERAGLAPGVLVAYFYLLYRFLQQLARAGYALSSTAFGWPHLRGLVAFREEAGPEETPAARPSSAALGAGPIGWRASGVTFSYPGGSADVLRDVDFDVAPGSVLVITGPSGSGKSTLLGLLAGGLLPISGRLEVVAGHGAVPIEEARGALPARLGYVGSESFLVEGTLRENLLYGGETASEEAIAQALAMADCGFVEALPGGLDHRLGDQGAGLSAGQRQRLGLARALLRAPGALILDEATGQLDAATEERVVDALAALKGRVTIVAATHRSALLRIADRRVELG